MQDGRVFYDDEDVVAGRPLAKALFAVLVLFMFVAAVIGIAVGVSQTPAAPSPAAPLTAWSTWCYETAPGVYRQTRLRNNVTRELRSCVTSSCLVFGWNTLANLTCLFNASTGLCAGATWTQTTSFYCATNATNFTDYLRSQTPFGVVQTSFSTAPANLTISGTSVQCIPECPVTNTSSAPAPSSVGPVPSPLTPCTYANYTDWSDSCLELSPGVYRQSRIRIPEPFQAECTDTRENRVCDLATCVTSTIVRLSSTDCVYDEDGVCASSSYTRTLTKVCETNAANLTDYLAATGVQALQSEFLESSPCDPECPRTGAPPAPVPTPTPTPSAPACLNSSVTPPWSVSCDEVTTEHFQQWRLVSDPGNAPACPVYYEYRDCIVEECMQYGLSLGSYFCYYSVSQTCFTASRQEAYALRCITNATNMAVYEAFAPMIAGNRFLGNASCPSNCPPLSSQPVVDVYFDIPVNLNITAPLVCTPPLYYDAGLDSCELCEPATPCATAIIDFQFGACRQVAKCVDNDRCSTNVCDPGTGACSFLPFAQNTLYLERQAVCDPQTGVVSLVPLADPAVGSLESCDDGDPNTVDSYDFTMNICRWTPIAPPVPPPNNATTCVATVINLATATQTTQTIANNWRCGPTGTDICYDGTCRNPASVVGDRCDYAVTIVDLFNQSVVKTVLNSGLCATRTINNQSFKTCSPTLCKNTVTNCAYCTGPQTQLDIALGAPFTCSCCATNSDCLGGHVCWGNRCV